MIRVHPQMNVMMTVFKRFAAPKIALFFRNMIGKQKRGMELKIWFLLLW